jgi:hypothetical protein
MKYGAHRERKRRERQAVENVTGLDLPSSKGSGNKVYIAYDDDVDAEDPAKYDKEDDQQGAAASDIDALPALSYTQRLKKLQKKVDFIPVTYHVDGAHIFQSDPSY